MILTNKYKDIIIEEQDVADVSSNSDLLALCKNLVLSTIKFVSYVSKKDMTYDERLGLYNIVTTCSAYFDKIARDLHVD